MEAEGRSALRSQRRGSVATPMHKSEDDTIKGSEMVTESEQQRILIRTRKRKYCKTDEGEEEEEEEDEREEVEKKIEALQRIVPGGEQLLGVDKLFEQTAGYILTLQSQIKAMKLLATLLHGLEKDKRKLGG